MNLLAQMGCFVAPLVFMFLNMASPVGGENSVYPVRISLNTNINTDGSSSFDGLGAYVCPLSMAWHHLPTPTPQQPNDGMGMPGFYELRLVVIRLRASTI